MAKFKETKTITKNRKAFHDYFIVETMEAGVVLTGTEIKSIRRGHVQLRDSFIRIKDGEAFMINAHIAHYEEGNIFNHEPTRTRKLLLHKKQIKDLHSKVVQERYTIVPTSIYLKNGRAKVAVSLAKGKKDYDKRHVQKEKDAKREIDRALRERGRYSE